jgi:Leucine-rich repeat (LRR) protein
MRKTRKQNGGNMAEAQRRIDKWITDSNVNKSLNLSNLNLTSLPRLPGNLKELYCDNNKLTSLPRLPDSLTYLYCSDNELTSLPTLPDGLKYLNCEYNKLTTVPKLPNSLKELYCNDSLVRLPKLPDTLERLTCSSNELTTLPKLPDSLEYLNCQNNKLTTLPTLPDSLKELHCDQNKLIRLPTLPDNLYNLSCEDNNLQSMFYMTEEDYMTGEEEVDDTRDYINRIRKLQKSRKNVINSLKPHITKKKRNVFANTTYTDMPKNVVKKIANYMNEEDLENINIKSLKPSNVKRNETKKLKKV